jgi:hypothetical protein
VDMNTPFDYNMRIRCISPGPIATGRTRPAPLRGRIDGLALKVTGIKDLDNNPAPGVVLTAALRRATDRDVPEQVGAPQVRIILENTLIQSKEE